MQSGGFITGGSLIKGRYSVLKKIGQGAFGEIYSGKNILNGEYIAIKVEKIDSKKQVLKLEVAVLKKLQACPYVCRFISCGRHNDYNYLVMELLGENLSELRRRQIDGKFSMSTTLKLGIQMIQSLEAIHDLGYLHRDVKPSNFAIGLAANKRNITYLIDFGLARRYVLPSGEIRPPRETTGFRGTARYASINSHLSKDLGRRDDLWSILYVLIEFASGQLPWRKLKDKDQIGDMKIKFNTPDLVKDLPPQFAQFMKHLKSLNYDDRPNYVFLQSLLNECNLTIGNNPLFDWEMNNNNNNTASNQTSNVSSSQMNIPRTAPSPSTVEASRDSPILNNRQDGENELESPQPQGHRKDSASASVIAASSEADNKESGSWNQKSSKKVDSINPDESNTKRIPLSNSSNNNNNNPKGKSIQQQHNNTIAKKAVAYTIARQYGFPKLYRKIKRLNHSYTGSNSLAKESIDSTVGFLFRAPTKLYNYFNPLSESSATVNKPATTSKSNSILENHPANLSDTIVSTTKKIKRNRKTSTTKEKKSSLDES
eukprot:gene3332-4177_t